MPDEDLTKINDVLEAVPVSSMIAKRGIKTARDFAEFMGALMRDVVEGTLSPAQANAACRAGSTMLQVVKMQHEYGERKKDGGDPVLKLT